MRGAIEQAAKRIYGFELQFGAFAVAQLRLLAEMIDLHADGSPGLFVTDTLSDPHSNVETGQGIYREISKSREASERDQARDPDHRRHRESAVQGKGQGQRRMDRKWQRQPCCPSE